MKIICTLRSIIALHNYAIYKIHHSEGVKIVVNRQILSKILKILLRLSIIGIYKASVTELFYIIIQNVVPRLCMCTTYEISDAFLGIPVYFMQALHRVDG